MPWDVVNERLVDQFGRPDPGNQDFTPWRQANDALAPDPIHESYTPAELRSSYAEATKPQPWDASRIVDTILGVPLLPLKILSGVDQAIKGGLGIHTLADDAAQAEQVLGGKEYDRPDAVSRFIGQITGDPSRQVEAAARIMKLAKERDDARKADLAAEKIKQGLVKGSLDIATEEAGMPFLSGNAMNTARKLSADTDKAVLDAQLFGQYEPRLRTAQTGQAEHNLYIGQKFDEPARVTAQQAADLAVRLDKLREEEELRKSKATAQLRSALNAPRAPGTYSLVDPSMGVFPPGTETEPEATTQFFDLMQKLKSGVDETGLTAEQRKQAAEHAAEVETKATTDAVARVNALIDKWAPGASQADDVEASKTGLFGTLFGSGTWNNYLSDVKLYEKAGAALALRRDLERALRAHDITPEDAANVAGGGAKIEDVTHGKYRSPDKWDLISRDILGQSSAATPSPTPTPTPSDDEALNKEFQLRWNQQNPAGGENTQVFKDARERWKLAKRAQAK